MNEEKKFWCKRCGNCCKVEGYVPITQKEISKIADALFVEEQFFIDEFTRILPNKSGLSLTESATGACVFLQKDNKCAIHEEKPSHCRKFPVKWHFAGYEKICHGATISHENK